MSGFITFAHAILVLWSIGYGFWCSGEAGTDLAPMEKTEQEALYSSIQGFVGNWWNGSDLYPDPCGWTPIQGVSCDLFDGLWYVTGLSIGPVLDNSLDCAENVELRPQLFELKRLKSLSFFNCFKSHPVAIPGQNWERLAGSLEALEFRSNPCLTGQVPSTLGNLANLQSLVLIENGLGGKLPPSIGNLIKLKRLVLAGNGFVGQIPDSLGSLTQLLILDLSRNRFSGNLSAKLGDFGSLMKLDLSSNRIQGNIPGDIGRLKNLTLLDLRNNKFSGGLAHALEDMHSLEELVLSDNPIGGDLKAMEWQKLQSLVVLDLSNMSLTGEIPESISGLKRLRYLGLSNNNLTGTISEELGTLPCIGAMYLNGNNLAGKVKLSESFFAKMGRRFGVWNNPNLCYQVESMPSSLAPFGVKPCVQEVTISEPSSVTKLRDHGSQSLASLGWSGFGIDGFWWILLFEVLTMTLMLPNCPLYTSLDDLVSCSTFFLGSIA